MTKARRVPNFFEPAEADARSAKSGDGVHRLASDALIGVFSGSGAAAVAITAGWFGATFISGREELAAGSFWPVFVATALIIAGAYLFFLDRIWRDARGRVSPWLIATVVLWALVGLSLPYGPAYRGASDDPRLQVAFCALLISAAFVGVAIFALIDGYNARRSSRYFTREEEKFDG